MLRVSYLAVELKANRCKLDLKLPESWSPRFSLSRTQANYPAISKSSRFIYLASPSVSFRILHFT